MPLVVSLMIVMIDERLNLRFQVGRKEVILKQDAVLQGLVPSLDLALCLRVIWCTPDVSHFPVVQPFSQLTRDVAGPIVR